jgi:hypothetical protein
MIATNIFVPAAGLLLGVMEFGFGNDDSLDADSSAASSPAALADSAVFGNPIHTSSEDGRQDLNEGDDTGDQATSEADM